jgi:hypothetical protein
MTTAEAEFDIDSLFTPELTPSEFLPHSVSDMDIDQAITQALAEIDQHGPLNVDQSHGQIIQDIFPREEYTQSIPLIKSDFPSNLDYVKPLSPQSLRSDDSQINSPSSSTILAQEMLTQEHQHMKLEMKKLKEHYDRKCRDLIMAMDELKENERKRLALMEENRALKDALVEVTMNISQ